MDRDAARRDLRRGSAPRRLMRPFSIDPNRRVGRRDLMDLADESLHALFNRIESYASGYWNRFALRLQIARGTSFTQPKRSDILFIELVDLLHETNRRSDQDQQYSLR
jgi:hypothetical protein